MDDIMNAGLTDILKANNIEVPGSGGGNLQSIGPGMYLSPCRMADRLPSMIRARSPIFSKHSRGGDSSPEKETKWS